MKIKFLGLLALIAFSSVGNINCAERRAKAKNAASPLDLAKAAVIGILAFNAGTAISNWHSSSKLSSHVPSDCLNAWSARPGEIPTNPCACMNVQKDGTVIRWDEYTCLSITKDDASI